MVPAVVLDLDIAVVPDRVPAVVADLAAAVVPDLAPAVVPSLAAAVVQRWRPRCPAVGRAAPALVPDRQPE